jgi:hypothetical protein
MAVKSFLLLMLVAGALASRNSALMKVTHTLVTDTQTKVNADGSKTSIYFAQYKDSDNGQMIYYKKIVEEAKRGQAGYNPEVYFRYSPSEDWKLLPKGCPAPEIAPKDSNDKCEKGWKVGKVIAVSAVYLGLKKGQEDATIAVPNTGYAYNPATNQSPDAGAKGIVIDAVNRINQNLQECLKKQLTLIGFTVERVCLHKGLVAESAAITNSLRDHIGDAAYNCDYATLRQNSGCLLIRK